MLMFRGIVNHNKFVKLKENFVKELKEDLL